MVTTANALLLCTAILLTYDLEVSFCHITHAHRPACIAPRQQTISRRNGHLILTVVQAGLCCGLLISASILALIWVKICGLCYELTTMKIITRSKLFLVSVVSTSCLICAKNGIQNSGCDFQWVYNIVNSYFLHFCQFINFPEDQNSSDIRRCERKWWEETFGKSIVCHFRKLKVY